MEYGKKTENHENVKNPLDDFKNVEITEKRPGIWRGKLKKWKI
ncbi:hypothetical protein T4D_9697 [Trichinella pseudospiralis]|uniref:Uncharacterized protein n=1 Tax=Trichinella pseudospiralis TaxID=6337 RepID=A0A0V1DL76_TRIPS|nr:hypothetical protein T4D_9697 [Trichinella pseudospiralis]